MVGISNAFGFAKSKGPGGRDPNILFNRFIKGFGAGGDDSELGLADFQEDLLKNIEGRADNPFIGRIVQGQEDLLRRLGGLSGQLDNLPNMLRRTALASTDAGAVAAAQAAKLAGAGRGGAAFGAGGASALASRAAQTAATQQGAALASSLVQGEQARAAFELQLGGLQGSITDALSRGRVAQAGLFEQRQAPGISARQQFLNIIGDIARAGIAGSGGSPSTRGRSIDLDYSGSFGLGGGGGGSQGF